MTADEFPDSLREALRKKLTDLRCSNKQAGVFFDVTSKGVADWVSGKTKSLAPEHVAKIAFFAAGYLDGFMDYLKQEADASPEETRALCRSLFALCGKIQKSKEAVFGGDKRINSLVQTLNDLLKKTLTEVC